MDERTAGFVDAFRVFLEEVVQSERTTSPAGAEALLPRLEAHLGRDPRGLPVVTDDVPSHLFVNLDVALSAIQERSGDSTLIGVGGGDQRRHNSLSEILEFAGRFGHFPIGTVDYVNLATGPDETRQAVSFGLRLFAVDGAPVAVLQRGPNPQFGPAVAQMEVLTPAEGVAATLIAAVHEEMTRRSVFRGQVLSLGGSDYDAGVGGVTFRRRPALTVDDIVLPAGVLERVQRHVAGVAHHRDRLRAAGQHLKRGLLLYGPPGTGKTHTVRYLTSSLIGTTVIQLTGSALHLIAEACSVARALQPAMLVIEDVDLIAEDRGMHPGRHPLLFQLLNEMDGWPRTSTWCSCSRPTARTSSSPLSPRARAGWTRRSSSTSRTPRPGPA